MVRQLRYHSCRHSLRSILESNRRTALGNVEFGPIRRINQLFRLTIHMLGAHLPRLSIGIAGYRIQHELGSSSILQYHGTSCDAVVHAREENMAWAQPESRGQGFTGAVKLVRGTSAWDSRHRRDLELDTQRCKTVRQTGQWKHQEDRISGCMSRAAHDQCKYSTWVVPHYLRQLLEQALHQLTFANILYT